MRNQKRIEVEDGMELTFDLISWDAQWEFDRPICVIAPVRKEDYSEAENIIEDLCVDACVNGYIQDDSGLKETPWCGPTWETLRRNHTKSLNGHKFGESEYFGYRVHVMFFRDKEGELQFRYTYWQEADKVMEEMIG